jgi:hypothetical protein
MGLSVRVISVCDYTKISMYLRHNTKEKLNGNVPAADLTSMSR